MRFARRCGLQDETSCRHKFAKNTTLLSVIDTANWVLHPVVIVKNMAAVTAIALLGNSHPVDGGLNPKFLVKLLEGDRALWEATSTEDGKIEISSSPGSPEITLEAGCRLINHLVEDFQLESLGLIIFAESSIANRINDVQSLVSLSPKFISLV
jgi:hypothetical protein